MRDRDHGQCLTDETLTEYLEGTLEPAIKAASEVHLVSCDECRNELAFFMRVLQEEVSSDESKALENISEEWRSKTEGKTATRRGLRFQRLIAFAAAAGVFAMCLFSVRLIVERWSEPKSGTELVQLLLEQNRPFESRIAGEPHRPILRTRGYEEPNVSYNLLAGEMTKLSANSHEMGTFYLLQKEFDRAIPYLEIAAQEVGAGAAVHNDLGVGYLESGNLSQMPKAGPEFLKALEQDKLFAAAAFNLALFYEQTNATAQAEAQWKRYLELDSTSDWATEARGRLQGLSR